MLLYPSNPVGQSLYEPFLGTFWGGLDFFDPLKMSLEMAHKVIVPPKKIISRSFLNSGTLIVNMTCFCIRFQAFNYIDFCFSSVVSPNNVPYTHFAPLVKAGLMQCCGSVTFWYGSGSVDPNQWLTDPNRSANRFIIVGTHFLSYENCLGLTEEIIQRRVYADTSETRYCSLPGTL